MRIIQLAAKADPDGVLRLTIPVGGAGSEYEVAVIVSPRPATNGAPPGKANTPEELGWPPGYLESTYGSITDETFVAPPRRAPEPVEPIE